MPITAIRQRRVTGLALFLLYRRSESRSEQLTVRPCHGNANEHALSLQLGTRHAAATAACHSAAASVRKIRSVGREMRWRCRSKVLWTAACMLRKRCAERAD